MTMRWLKRILLGGWLIFCGGMLYYSMSLGIADIIAKTARYGVQQGHKLTLEEWETSHAAIHKALAFDPHNPEWLEALGHLYTLQANQQSPNTMEQWVAYQRALIAFRQASQYRPASASSWTNKMLLKQTVQEYDAEFFKALENAALLGPWDTFAQGSITQIGLNHWDKLSSTAQQTVFATIKRGLLTQGKPWITTLVLQHPRQNVVCSQRERYLQVKELCTRK